LRFLARFFYLGFLLAVVITILYPWWLNLFVLGLYLLAIARKLWDTHTQRKRQRLANTPRTPIQEAGEREPEV
jgi:hypothetical protein